MQATDPLGGRYGPLVGSRGQALQVPTLFVTPHRPVPSPPEAGDKPQSLTAVTMALCMQLTTILDGRQTIGEEPSVLGDLVMVIVCLDHVFRQK
jgi:hypothetical protein